MSKTSRSDALQHAIPGAAASLPPVSAESESVVQLLYRAVLRRDADPNGLQVYRELLESGRTVAELVRRLSSSDEFRAKILVSSARDREYDIAHDPDISRFFTAGVSELTGNLRKPSLSRSTYEAAAETMLSKLRSMDNGFAASQCNYVKLHRDRFYEIDCVLNNLIAKRAARVSVLDFGYSINSLIVKTIFPEVKVSVADRPQMRVPDGEFAGVFRADLTDDGLEKLDWRERFDVIVFSEVLEHVLVNPVRVIRFLLKHLNVGGCCILTTPNLFSAGKLNLIRRRRNPLPLFPLSYKRADAPHFHVREYCMSELLRCIEEGGGRSVAFFFSACWDSSSSDNKIPPDELGNLFVVFGGRDSTG